VKMLTLAALRYYPASVRIAARAACMSAFSPANCREMRSFVIFEATISVALRQSGKRHAQPLVSSSVTTRDAL
jgi:hypothetical protein